jgi:hypothetical protein
MNLQQALIQDDQDAAIEQFAEGIIDDLKQFGEATYWIRCKEETLTFSEVVESWDCEMDEVFKAFHMMSISSLQVRVEMNKHIKKLAYEIAERAFK